MSREFRVKWCLYLLQKNGDNGNCAIVVVLFILLLISVAIGLPYFIARPSRPRQSVAVQYISATNRAQRAYYFDNGKFVTENSAEAWRNLGIGIKPQTKNYTFSIGGDNQAVFSYGLAREEAENPLKSYVGGVFILANLNLDKSYPITVSIICETKFPTTIKPANPILKDDEITCGDNTIPLNYSQDLMLASAYIEAFIGAQQKYVSKKGNFANSIPLLGFKIKLQTENYQYSVITTNEAAFHYATSRQDKYISYVGGVFRIPESAKYKIETIVCQNIYPDNSQAANPIYQNGVLACASGTREILKNSY